MTPQIVIIFGGTSDERRVSVASGQNIARVVPGAALLYVGPDGRVYECGRDELSAHAQPFVTDFKPKLPAMLPSLAALLDADADMTRSLAREGKTDPGRVFFLAFHGGEGEDGTLQKLFEDRRIAFTGSGSIASAKAFHKRIAKEIAAKEGVRVAPEVEIHGSHRERARDSITTLFHAHRDLILKPVSGGSSIGLFHLKDERRIDPILSEIAKSGVPYLVEPFLSGKEITVGVFDDRSGLKALPVSEVRTAPDTDFDYEGKYLGRGSLEITPAEIPAAEAEACQALAVKMHRALGCEGYSRTDIILSKDGPCYLETNTLPGLTSASFIPQQLAAAKIPFADFLERQFQIAKARLAKYA